MPSRRRRGSAQPKRPGQAGGRGAPPPSGQVRARFAWLAVVAAIALTGAIMAFGRSREEPPGDATAAFDGDRALNIVKSLVERGHRYDGAAKRDDAIEALRALLDAQVDQTAIQRFEVEDDAGAAHQMANIIGRQNPSRPRRVLLGTHWDTRRWAEEDEDPARRDEPIAGANDGTSGVAVLVEVARTLRARGFDRLGVDYVLFDGEEFGRPGSDDYCQGSRYFARMSKALYPASRPEWAVVVDMVGDCDLEVLPEQTSLRRAPRVVRRLWRAAEAAGHGDVFGVRPRYEIEDDHTALQKVGIPAVLLIDYDYPHWHTHGDTLDKVCASSLRRVGDTLVRAIEQHREGDLDGQGLQEEGRSRREDSAARVHRGR